MKELEQYKNYLSTQDISQNTRESYIRDILLYIKWCEQSSGEDVDMAVFNDFEIMQYRSYLLNVAKYKASTINRKIIAIRNFCRWAVNEGLLDKNPASNIKQIKDMKHRLAPRALSMQEVFKLRRTLHRYGSKRDIALIELMLNCGPRVSEVCRLKEEDVEMSERKGILKIIGKGNKLREVPINSETRKYLRDYLEVKPNSPYLIVSQKGGEMNRSTIFRIIKKYANMAGLDDTIHPHSLRHTFAQRLIDKGTDLFNVQYLLGHSNITTTQRYHRPKLEVQEQAVENMYM